MLSEIKSKFMKNPTLYYGMSVAASWAGVGSLMNSVLLTTSYGIVPSIIWGFANSIACVIFGIIACRLDTFRDLMRSRAMQCIIGIMSIFQLWLNMNGIHDIFSDTVIGARGGSWRSMRLRRIIRPSARTSFSSTRSGTPLHRTP